MPEMQKHIFLIPLFDFDSHEFEKIIKIAKTAAQKFLFLISIQNLTSYNEYIDKLDAYSNIIAIHPPMIYSRTAHWSFIARYAYKNISFSSFSYVFKGDDIHINDFPENIYMQDILINDYYINNKNKIKENISNKFISKLSFSKKIYLNLLIGKPLLAPLQKIIFNKKVISDIYFDDSNPFIADQKMVFDLIEKGFSADFIKEPFYQLNTKCRFFSKKIKTREIIRQQIMLFHIYKCPLGIPAVILRTLLKQIL